MTQVVRVLLRPQIKFKDGQPLPPHKRRLLIMFDEFPSYGRLDVFEESLSYIAGYGIKAYLIGQDIAQFWKAYTKEETIISNCHVRIAYAPNKIETAEWLSRMTGIKTEMKWQVTESGKRFGAVADQFSRTSQETHRPLMQPDEAMRMKTPVKDKDGKIVNPGEMLIFTAGGAPILGTQILYFRDPVFFERAQTSPPKESDRIPGRELKQVIEPATEQREPDRSVIPEPSGAHVIWNAEAKERTRDRSRYP
jgi:type IV secretion system protein VirD4